MRERPLILFPVVSEVSKMPRYGRGSKFFSPTVSAQRNRLEPQLAALQNSLSNITLQTGANGIEPEFALVFEICGDVSNFFKAVKKFNETYNHQIEWITEFGGDGYSADDNFYYENDDGSRNNDKVVSTKIFCIVTNREALNQMLSMWNQFSEANSTYTFPRGLAGLRDVFLQLKSIHRWSIKEKLEDTGIIESWQDDIQDPAVTMLKCEIEFFYRSNQQKRLQIETEITSQIVQHGGRVLHKADISEIGYHALLVEIPKTIAQSIISNPNIDIVINDDVMFINPKGQSVVTMADDSFDYTVTVNNQATVANEPIVALFDGLPQENHTLLQNLLVVDDPDNYAQNYLIADRKHGTSMASLILRGELDSDTNDFFRKLYVRPIMKPVAGLHTNQEYVPDDVLFVDKLHECVRRLFEAQAGRVASTIKVINLSIGITNRPLLHSISPLAKLIDWLSHKYRVLFIVSAGNHPELDLGINFNSFVALSNAERNKQIISQLHSLSRNRRLLSPAESVNALTIGAQFDDSSTPRVLPNQIIPCDNLPSPASALGWGYNKSIKPDIFYKGGRCVILENVGNPNELRWRHSVNYAPGIKSAAPYTVGISTQKAGYAFGTSQAAALMSRNAVLCYEALLEIFNSEQMNLPEDKVAVILKAMLIHGARWDENIATIIKGALPTISGRGADALEKWMGHGVPDISKVMECTKNRITLIGYGDLKQGQAHSYEIPVPFTFNTGSIRRKLTVSLANLTSTKASNQKYRESIVWFDFDSNCKSIFGSRQNVSDKAARRGTLQHEIFESDMNIGTQSESIKIVVSCAENATKDSNIITPYALLTTFEIAEPTTLDVYADVLTEIRARTLATARVTTI